MAFSFHPPSLPPQAQHYDSLQHGHLSRPGSSSRPLSANANANASFPHLTQSGPPYTPREDQDDPLRGSSSHGLPAHVRPGSSSGTPHDSGADSGGRPTAAAGGGPANESSTSSPPSPFQHNLSHHPLFAQPTYQNGVTRGNTRPVTAPSSVSAPYFGGGAYYSHANGPPVSSSFYAPPAFHHHQSLPQPPLRTFQYHVDSSTAPHPDDPASNGEGYRARNFSLPELVGLETLPDEPRYTHEHRSAQSRSPPSTFFYGPPPTSLRSPPGGPFFHHPPPTPHSQAQGSSSPEQSSSDMYSRPTTGDSRSTSSSRTTVGPPLGHPGTTAPHVLHGPSPVYPHPFTGLDGPLPPSAGGPPLHGAGAGQAGNDKGYSFIAQPGQANKRPRRRYDEIERLYNCDYPGCQKAYGTLNHLNSHKTMQKHGPRSTPAEFKERRAAWRAGKKAAAAAASAASAERGPTSSSDGSLSPVRSTGERPRPSTSAGEYHYNLPAPFMSSIGTPIGAPFATHEPDPARWSGVYDPHAHAYGGSVRPVTAPSYYQAPPAFGFQQTPSLTLPPPLPIYGTKGPHERRMSLPHSGGMFAFSGSGHDEPFPPISEEATVFHGGDEDHHLAPVEVHD